MRIMATMLLLLFLANPLFAQEEADASNSELYSNPASSIALNGIFIGLGPEVNFYTRDGIALGGTLLAGAEFQPMAAGLRASFFNDLNTVSVLEIHAFFRYFMPFLPGLYAQAEAGIMNAFEFDASVLSFAGGAAVGYRINITDAFFIEPSARFGYPYIGGISVIAGYKFKMEAGNE